VAHHGGNFINESPVDATAAADARADASAQAQTPAHSPKQPPSAQHESDDLRRALTDMLIHDLRAPLGIINWNMEQLLDGVSASAALNAEQERFVKASIESTQELLEMADSLLDIDRLENGVLALNPEDCSLEQLAKTIAGRMDFMTQQMALRFSFSFPEGYSAIRADRQLMRRVLFNLLFNASKYAPEKSTIYIEGGSDHEKIWLSVEDEGQGIPEKYLESIFDKYVQAEARSVHGNIRGKGLGLTFCRLAVEAHGGSIRALNARGARFIVELPRSLP
jgi:K+-sensing histidine kinase KdpD